jgi:hypothetical protein
VIAFLLAANDGHGGCEFQLAPFTVGIIVDKPRAREQLALQHRFEYVAAFV